MLDIKLDFPNWIIFLFLGVVLIFFALNGLGIYYLVTKKFEKVTLWVSVFLVFAFTIWTSPSGFLLKHLINVLTDLNGLLMFAMIYLAVFAVINFFHRLIYKIVSS